MSRFYEVSWDSSYQNHACSAVNISVNGQIVYCEKECSELYTWERLTSFWTTKWCTESKQILVLSNIRYLALSLNLMRTFSFCCSGFEAWGYLSGNVKMLSLPGRGVRLLRVKHSGHLVKHITQHTKLEQDRSVKEALLASAGLCTRKKIELLKCKGWSAYAFSYWKDSYCLCKWGKRFCSTALGCAVTLLAERWGVSSLQQMQRVQLPQKHRKAPNHQPRTMHLRHQYLWACLHCYCFWHLLHSHSAASLSSADKNSWFSMWMWRQVGSLLEFVPGNFGQLCDGRNSKSLDLLHQLLFLTRTTTLKGRKTLGRPDFFQLSSA